MSFCLDIPEDSAPALLDTANTGIGRCIEHAGRYLSNAVLIWRMVDPDKAVDLERLLEEIRFPPHQARLRLHREQVERLKELLVGIETAAVGKIMDQDYQVLANKVDYVIKHAPDLPVRTTDGKGNTIYMLDKITEIEWLRSFLETALELGCDVIKY